jgi:hypothetical protein
LDVSTSFRFHFGEVFFSLGFKALQIYLLGISLLTYLVYELAFQCATPISSQQCAFSDQDRARAQQRHCHASYAWHPPFHREGRDQLELFRDFQVVGSDAWNPETERKAI